MIDEALGWLASASLLTFSTDDASVAAHRLTMRVAAERQARDGTLAGLGAGLAGLLRLVTGSLAEPWRNRAAARDVIGQATALHEHLAPYLAGQDIDLTGTLLDLRSWAIGSLNDLGDSSAQAIEYGQDLVTDCEQVLGQAHPGTLTSRNNLAGACQDAGRVTEAIPLFERTLADRMGASGRWHGMVIAQGWHDPAVVDGLRVTRALITGAGHPLDEAGPEGRTVTISRRGSLPSSTGSGRVFAARGWISRPTTRWACRLSAGTGGTVGTRAHDE
jgi:hypothetical protein